MRILKSIFIVLVFLASFVYTIVKNETIHCGYPKPKVAQINLHQIELALIEYKYDTGHFPKTLTHLITNNQSKDWLGPYLKEKKLKDPWGENYQYQLSSDQQTFVLNTLGSDK